MFDQTQNPQMMPPMMGQYQYQPQQQVHKQMNALSAEEIKQLQQERSQFSLGLTTREMLQGSCTHRSIDGMSDSLTYDPVTGIARCSICGYEFKPIEAETSLETIKDSCDTIVDILQTIKILYTDLPADAAREYFQIIPLIGKIPQLFEFAAKNFAKHEANNWQYNNYNMGGISMLNNLNNMFGMGMGGMAPQPMYQQPMMNPQQPTMAGYPQAAYGAPMGGNAFGYQGASQVPPQGYAPTNPAFQYPPTPQATPAAPTVSAPAAPADAAPATDTVTQNVSV